MVLDKQIGNEDIGSVRPFQGEHSGSPLQYYQSNNAPILVVKYSEGTGGKGGIRTHGGASPAAVFETAPIVHSGTFPPGIIAQAFRPSKTVAAWDFVPRAYFRDIQSKTALRDCTTGHGGV